MTANYYELLDLPIDATSEEIRAAYREMARMVHPDANPNPEAAEQFIELQNAYETLMDEDRRNVYNKSLPASFTTLPLSISALYSRSFVQQIDEPQILYVLLRLAPPGFDLTGPGTPLNLCLVVDCSTSMQGELLDTVKATATGLIRQLKPEDIISIVAFSDRAEVIVPAAANQDPQLLLANVRMLHAKGGTEIFQGLEAGYKEVQRHRNKKYANHIILITDGRTYGDEAQCERLAEQAAGLNIGISGLGIGGKWNDVFLDRLTSKTGGSSMFVSKPKDVESFLKNKVAGLGMSYAEHLEYDLVFGDEVELRYAFRLQPDITPLQLTPPIRLGAVPRHSTLEIILDFVIHPKAIKNNSVSMTEGRVYFDVPSQINPLRTVRLDLARPASVGTDPLPPPQAIVQAMSALTLYRIQEQARLDVANGKYNEATRRLQNVATHLLANGQSDLAQTVLGEAVHIQDQQSFSEDGDKRIKYGTRALMLPPGT